MNANDLSETKQRLLEKLGPSYGTYIQLLGKWFRGVISKEELDQSARKLIDNSFVLEHNQFWLAFFHHCANNANKSINSFSSFHPKDNDPINSYDPLDNGTIDYEPHNHLTDSPDSAPCANKAGINNIGSHLKCLPNKVMTHMKIYVIAWEMGLDSVNDSVSIYINLALHNFLKSIITELICAKTAHRLRENRFKYAIGVKPLNPYLNNSLKIISSNLEYDPYQIESNRMNSSLVDSYAYNDNLFPSRLYEAQALYEFACSTTSVRQTNPNKPKRPKLMDISLSPERCELLENIEHDLELDVTVTKGRRVTLFHLLMAFIADKSILSSQTLYSITLERILAKLCT